MEKLRLPSNEFCPSRRASSRSLEDLEYDDYARTILNSRHKQPLSPESQPVSPSKARWAAVLHEARDKLERETGEVTARALPEQTHIDFNPWNYGIKKKGKTNASDHYMVYAVISLPPSDKQQSQSHGELLKFNKPVVWQSRDKTERSTTSKHPTRPVYPYTPMPPNFDVYKNPKELSSRRRRLIACGHRFHHSTELEIIPEDKQVSFKKPHLPRVELLAEAKSQGPRVIEPAPLPATTSTWAMVVGVNKPLPALPNATATSTQTKPVSAKKVLLLKPVASKKKKIDAKSTTGPGSKPSLTDSSTLYVPQHDAPASVSTITAKIPERPLTRTMTKTWAKVASENQDDALHKKLAKMREEESATPRNKLHAKWRGESAPWESNLAQRREEAAQVDRKLVEVGLRKLPDLRPQVPTPDSYCTDPTRALLMPRFKMPLDAYPASSSSYSSSYSSTKVQPDTQSPAPMTNTPSQSSTVAPTKRSANSPPNDGTPKKKMRTVKDTSSAVEIRGSSLSSSSSSPSSSTPAISATTTTTDKCS